MGGYYLIRQVISKNIKQSFKIYTPANLTHLQVLLDNLIGNLFVYLVDAGNNSNKNLTNELGRTNFNYQEFRSNHTDILKSRIRFSLGKGSWACDDITIYSINDPSQFFPKEFFCNNYVTFPYYIMIEQLTLSEFDVKPEKIFAGKEYELFIGQKYENLGYKVEYRGIDLEKEDGGIDLIAENEKTVVLVQCKNWINIDNYQIESRDLRAFIGDCFLYKINNSTVKPIAFHFIVSDDQMLSESARFFVQTHGMIKLKEVRFEISNNLKGDNT